MIIACKCRLSILIISLLYVAATAAASQESAPTRAQTLNVNPQSVVRSSSLHLGVRDAISVTGNSEDSRFAVDLFIYDKDKILVAKDDPEINSSVFSWQPTAEGDYYVLARNLGEASGQITVSVTTGKGIPAGQPAQNATIKIFYATDREMRSSANPNDTFGPNPEPSGRLRLGESWVSIPRAHEMGELEGPSIFRLEFKENPAKHVVLERIEDEPANLFLDHLSNGVAHSRHKEILVFIHGFNTTFADATRRTAQIAYDLGFDGPAIAYSWPSQGELGLIAYNKDSRNADLTADHLKVFLSMLAAKSGATTIHLIAHSMGNRPLTNVLNKPLTGSPQPNQQLFNQVVLMAPDIDAAVFKQMAQQLARSARRVTLYVSSRDVALKFSNTYAGYPRAGQGGQGIIVTPGIDTIDASSVDTSNLGFSHQYYADNSTVLSDLFYVMRGDPAASRFRLERESTSAGTYWQFKAAAR
jgi:esterase/lipase superfamily enzyme